MIDYTIDQVHGNGLHVPVPRAYGDTRRMWCARNLHKNNTSYHKNKRNNSNSILRQKIVTT